MCRCQSRVTLAIIPKPCSVSPQLAWSAWPACVRSPSSTRYAPRDTGPSTTSHPRSVRQTTRGALTTKTLSALSSTVPLHRHTLTLPVASVPLSISTARNPYATPPRPFPPGIPHFEDPGHPDALHHTPADLASLDMGPIVVGHVRGLKEAWPEGEAPEVITPLGQEIR